MRKTVAEVFSFANFVCAVDRNKYVQTKNTGYDLADKSMGPFVYLGTGACNVSSWNGRFIYSSK